MTLLIAYPAYLEEPEYVVLQIDTIEQVEKGHCPIRVRSRDAGIGRAARVDLRSLRMSSPASLPPFRTLSGQRGLFRASHLFRPRLLLGSTRLGRV